MILNFQCSTYNGGRLYGEGHRVRLRTLQEDHIKVSDIQDVYMELKRDPDKIWKPDERQNNL